MMAPNGGIRMNRIRRWTKNILDAAAFGAAVLVFVLVLAALLYSAHSAMYVKERVDKIFFEWIDYSAKLDARLDRLDGYAQYLQKRYNRLEPTNEASVQKTAPKGNNTKVPK